MSNTPHVADRYAAAKRAFEAIHAEDPSQRASRYHERLAAWLVRLAPDASEALRIAAHCQHLRRWAIPRADFPVGRAGYKTWRTTLMRQHASEAENVLRRVGYGDDTVSRVRQLLLKKGLGHDDEVQCFEDAICLVFMEQELVAFASKHDDDKLVAILQKTWNKMSPQGHEAALALAAELPADTRTLVLRAVS